MTIILAPVGTLAAASASSSNTRPNSTRAALRASARQTKIKKPVASSASSVSSVANSSSAKSPVSSDGMVDLGVKILPHGEILYISFIERGSPADLAGLQAGDELHEIDGHAIQKYASSEKVLQQLRGPEGSKFTLEIGRFNKGLIEIPVTRKWNVVPTTSRIEVKDNVLFITPENLTVKGVDAMRTQVKALGQIPDSVLIDLRKKPAGSLEGAIAFAGMFLAKNTHIAWLETKKIPSENLFENAIEKLMTNTDPLLAAPKLGIIVQERGSPMGALLIADAIARHANARTKLFTSNSNVAKGTASATWTIRTSKGIDVVLGAFMNVLSTKTVRTPIGCKEDLDRTWCITGIDETLITSKLISSDENADAQKALELMKW